jgi:hypothetical protein
MTVWRLIKGIYFLYSSCAILGIYRCFFQWRIHITWSHHYDLFSTKIVTTFLGFISSFLRRTSVWWRGYSNGKTSTTSEHVNSWKVSTELQEPEETERSLNKRLTMPRYGIEHIPDWQSEIGLQRDRKSTPELQFKEIAVFTDQVMPY